MGRLDRHLRQQSRFGQNGQFPCCMTLTQWHINDSEWKLAQFRVSYFMMDVCTLVRYRRTCRNATRSERPHFEDLRLLFLKVERTPLEVIKIGWGFDNVSWEKVFYLANGSVNCHHKLKIIGKQTRVELWKKCFSTLSCKNLEHSTWNKFHQSFHKPAWLVLEYKPVQWLPPIESFARLSPTPPLY